MESGALEVPPALTAQNDLIWTVLILIGIPPVSTQIGGCARAWAKPWLIWPQDG